MMHFARTTYVNFTEQDAAEIAIAKRKGVDAGIKNNSKKRQKTTENNVVKVCKNG